MLCNVLTEKENRAADGLKLRDGDGARERGEGRETTAPPPFFLPRIGP